MTTTLKPSVEMTSDTTVAAPEALPNQVHPAGRGLFRYAVAVIVAVVLLIKFGGMVTSTGSGMAYETWPDADGFYLIPPDMDLPKFLEHGHRLFGALIGLLTIGLLIGIWRADSRSWMRRLGIGLLVLVIIQGIIGGVGVLMNLPYVTSVLHGTLAQLFLCSLTVTAFALSAGWQTRVTVPAAQVRTARNLGKITLFAILIQLVVGAILRHSNNESAKWIHVGFALVVALMVLILGAYCSGKFRHVRGFSKTTGWLLGILGMQLVLGFVTLAVRLPKAEENVNHLARATTVTTHVVMGAALFLITTLLVARCFRNLVPDRSDT